MHTQEQSLGTNGLRISINVEDGARDDKFRAPGFAEGGAEDAETGVYEHDYQRSCSA
jgi:hypothetical protein